MGEHTKDGQSRLFNLSAAALIGGAPVWMILLIWDFSDRQGGWPIIVRSNSLVVPFIEFIFVLIAMATSFSPLQAIQRLPKMTKLAVLLWLSITIWTSFQQGNDYFAATLGFIKLFCAALFLLVLIEFRRASSDKLFAAIWFGVACSVPSYISLWLVQMALTQPSGNEWVIQIPGVNNIRHVGHFAFAGFFAAVACLILLRNHPSAFWRWCIPVFFAASSLGLAMWTGSRGPLFAAVVGATIVLIFGTGLRRQLCLLFGTSSLIAAAVVVALPVPHPIYGALRAGGITDLNAESAHDSSSGRTELWAGTIEKISEKPILGWGLEQFSAFGPKATLGMLHPHNFPLQILFSGGVLSILLSTLLLFPLLRNYSWPYRDGIGLAGMGCVAGTAIYSMYDGVLFYSYPIMIFILAFATSIRPFVSQPAPGRLSSHDRTISNKATI